VTLHLHGLGHAHPEQEITNRLLEELDIGTTPEWILERVGIQSRRTVLPLDYIRSTRNRDVRAAREAARETNAALGVRAAALALRRAGVPATQVGLVISGSSAPGTLCPAEATCVAQALGIEAPAFDVNSACTTFLAQLRVLAAMRPEALPDFALLVQAETITTAIDYADRNSAVLFGDGAAAAVVSARLPGRARILHVDLGASPSGADKVVIQRTGHFAQDGRAVQMFAIKRTGDGYARIAEARGREAARPLHFVGHQANLRVLEQVCRRCDVPPERHHQNVEHFGNTGGASAPSVLSMQWEKWQPHDDVALSVVGAGLSFGRALLRFGDAA
jgi:3-oxoacyl-[acyl-carrier-protein] synthase-3